MTASSSSSSKQKKSFNELVKKLHNVKLQVNVDLWYSEECVGGYRKFCILLADALEWFSMDDSIHHVSTIDCKRLLNLLYALCTSNIARLSISHPNAKDIYMECPLVTFYLGIGSCLLFLRENTTFIGYRDFFIMDQDKIDYCNRYRLIVKYKMPIERFTFEDIALSFLKLEMNVALLDYSLDLEAYIDALELRLCELLLHANVDNILNNAMYRTQIKGLIEHQRQQYCCSTSGEYYLVISVLAIRKLITSSLPVCRADGVQRSIRDCGKNDLDIIDRLKQIFIVKYANVHSDDIDNEFCERYKEQKTFLFEIFLFQKLNGIETRLDYPSIVSQFRNRTNWDNIANASHTNIGQYLEESNKNCVAFRVIFMQIAELFFQQQLQISWTQFCLDGEQLYKMDKLAFEEFSEKSHRLPYFVKSFNDACIFFRGQLFIFGKTSVHYFHAFKEWLDIVASECNYTVNDGSVSIRPLLDYICNDTECFKIIPKDDVDDHTRSIDLTQLSRKKQVQLRAHESFKYILTGLNTEDHVADASNTIGDIDATGLENSGTCGWSFL